MLTQRAAKLFMFGQRGIHVAKCHLRLDEANEEFLATLQQLKAETYSVPGLASRLDSSVDVWKLFQSAMIPRSAGEFPQAARKVFRISEDLLNRMDAIIEICVGLPGVMSRTTNYPASGPAAIA
jgi:hypothetical protein